MPISVGKPRGNINIGGNASERISQCFTFCDFLMSVVQCKRVAISLEKKIRFLKEALLKTSQGTAGKPSKSIHVVMLRPNESPLLPCFSNKKNFRSVVFGNPGLPGRYGQGFQTHRHCHCGVATNKTMADL